MSLLKPEISNSYYNNAALRGAGYYNDAAILGSGKLVKGSRAAKKRMAYLRSLRGKKLVKGAESTRRYMAHLRSLRRRGGACPYV